MNPYPLYTYLESLKDIKGFIQRHQNQLPDELWEVAERNMVLFEHVGKGDVGQLTLILMLEMSFGSWLLDVGHEALDRVTSAVEILGAWIDADENIEEVGAEVVRVLGQERVEGGSAFVEWFDAWSPSYNIENGHIYLAMTNPTGEKSVFHAGRGNDPGVCEMVWEKTGRHWSWMSGHRGGFLQAGLELVAIRRERIGRVLMQNAHTGAKGVAMKLALYGGDEMAGEVREVIGIEPYGGGVFEPGLEFRLVGHSDEVLSVSAIGDDMIVTAGYAGTIKLWNYNNGRCVKTMEGTPFKSTGMCVVGGVVVVCGYDRGVGVSEMHVIDLVGDEQRIQVMTTGKICELMSVDDATFVSREECRLRVWRMEPDRQVVEGISLEGHATFECMTSLGNYQVASAGGDGTIIVHDVTSGYVVEQIECTQGDETWAGHAVTALCVMPDGRIICGCSDFFVRVLSADGGKVERALNVHREIVCITILDDGMIAVATGRGWICVVREVPLKEELPSRATVPSHLPSVVLAMLRRWLSIIGSSLWLRGSGQPVEKTSYGMELVGQVKASSGDLHDLQSLPGSRVAAVGSHVRAAIWDLSRMNLEQSGEHEDDLMRGCVVADGRIVTGGSEGDMIVWRPCEAGKQGEVDRKIGFPGDFQNLSEMVGVKGGFAWWNMFRRELRLVRLDEAPFDRTFKLWLRGGVRCVNGDILSGVQQRIFVMLTVNNGEELVALDGERVNVWLALTGQQTLSIETPCWNCMAAIDNNRLVVAEHNRIGVVNLRSGGVEKVWEGLNFGEFWCVVSVCGGRKVIGWNDDWELHCVDLEQQGASELVGDGIEKLFNADLGDGKVVVRTLANQVVVWNWQHREVDLILGGLRGLDVWSASWDPVRRLMVFFLNPDRFWVAYEL